MYNLNIHLLNNAQKSVNKQIDYCLLTTMVIKSYQLFNQLIQQTMVPMARRLT